MSTEPATVIIEKLDIALAEAQNALNDANRAYRKLSGEDGSDEDTRPTKPVIRTPQMGKTISFMPKEGE